LGYFAGALSAGLSAAGLVVVVFLVVLLFLVVVVLPFFVFDEVDEEDLASVVAAGFAVSWAKAANEVARTSAVTRFFIEEDS
jgi:hypothetical protein